LKWLKFFGGSEDRTVADDPDRKVGQNARMAFDVAFQQHRYTATSIRLGEQREPNAGAIST
jgi:hypothetical protein